MFVAKTNAAKLLERLGLDYELRKIELSEDDLSAETAAQKLALPLERVYKTLVLRGDKTGILEACLPAGHQLDLKALARASGNRRVELVAVNELMGLTGYCRGGCSPLEAKKKYPVYILAEALKQSFIVVNAGARGLMLLVKPADLFKAAEATAF